MTHTLCYIVKVANTSPPILVRICRCIIRHSNPMNIQMICFTQDVLTSTWVMLSRNSLDSLPIFTISQQHFIWLRSWETYINIVQLCIVECLGTRMLRYSRRTRYIHSIWWLTVEKILIGWIYYHLSCNDRWGRSKHLCKKIKLHNFTCLHISWMVSMQDMQSESNIGTRLLKGCF